MTSEPDKSAPIMSADAVLSAAREYSRMVQEALGGTRVSYQPVRNTSRCTGGQGEDAGPDGPRWLYYGDQVILPGDQHHAAVERVRGMLAGRGMVVSEITAFPIRGGVRLKADNPQDGFGIQVLSTSPPTEIGITVYSPCYLPPAASGTPSAWRAGVGAGPQAM